MIIKFNKYKIISFIIHSIKWFKLLKNCLLNNHNRDFSNAHLIFSYDKNVIIFDGTDFNY